MLVAWIVVAVAAVFAVSAVATIFLGRAVEAASPPAGRFVEIGGRRIHLVDRRAAGRPDGPVIVVLHGAVSSLLDPLAALDGRLDAIGRVVFVDRPGHGYSDRLGKADATLVAQANVVAGVLDALAVDRAVIVGHSFGGAVAATFALRHPERTAGLVLIGAPTHPWPGGIAFAYRLVAAAVVGPFVAATVATPIGLVLLSGGVRAVFEPEPLPKDFSPRAGYPLSVRAGAFRATGEDVVALFDGVAAQVADYPAIRAPTAIIAGDRDGIVSSTLHARAMAAAVPGARLTILPGAGHMVHATRPEAVVAAVQDVVARAEAVH